MLVSRVSTTKGAMLVSMRYSEAYEVPSDLALLYDFVNTLDERRFLEKGIPHIGGDEIGTPRLLADWMHARGLLGSNARISPADHRTAIELRQALRDFLRSPPDQRPRAEAAARRLTAASRAFPLALVVSDTGSIELAPAAGSNALGRVLAQVTALDGTYRLDRLKTCVSDECSWIFFDRSKPANRHWCSSALCGNREKTRAYRARHGNGS